MKSISKKIMILGLILVSVLSFGLVYKVFDNEKSIKERKTNTDTVFAVMIEQEDGTYVESSENTWPTDKIFNNELSNCVDINGNKLEGVLSFDNDNYVAKVKAKKTVYCYLYFDEGTNVFNE